MQIRIPEIILRHRLNLIEASVLVVVVFTAAILAFFFEIDGRLDPDARLDLVEMIALGFLLIGSLGFFVWRRMVEQEREITARLKAEDQARFLALHDHLTGLPNRRQLAEALGTAVRILPSAERSHGLFVLDLNGFKKVNDNFGHARGDQVLNIVAERLSINLREGDLLARMGGDEFAMVVRDIVGASGAAAVATRILTSLEEPIAIGSDLHRIGTGIGISLVPQDGLDPDELLRKADVALYKTKQSGAPGFAFYEDAMDREARERDLLQRELAAAIGTSSLVPFFQPIVDLKTGHIRAFEALARWTHAELGEIAPDRFIPLAEETGLMKALSDHLLRLACEQARSWPDDIGLSFNVSPSLLRDPTLGLRLIEIAATTGFPLRRLELEITENAIVRDLEGAQQTLGALHDAGVRIALDDFGTGSTSLYHLRSFKFDVIKIDRSFVDHMGAEQESAAIVKALLGLGRGLGVEIVAEGVEEATQSQMLQDEGCTIGQGFLFSHAVSGAEALKLLAASGERASAA